MPLDESKRSVVERRLRALLGMREWPKTICPSEVARALSTRELGQLNAAGWRDTMDDIREVVFRLRDSGELDVLQKGKVVDDSINPDNVHGPIRVRAKQNTK
jgi:hypothetical protein